MLGKEKEAIIDFSMPELQVKSKGLFDGSDNEQSSSKCRRCFHDCYNVCQHRP